MQSPFEIFRKHQKMLTVVLTGLAMFAFVILGAIPDPAAISQSPALTAIFLAGIVGGLAWVAGIRKKKSNEWGLMGVIAGLILGVAAAFAVQPGVVVRADTGNIDNQELNGLFRQRSIGNSFVNMAYQRARANGAQMFQNPPTFGFGHPDETKDIVVGELLRREADRLGMQVTDETVNDFIRSIGQDKLGAADIREIRNTLGLSETGLYEALKQELKAYNMARFLYGGNTLPPVAYWDFYRKMNVQESVGIVPVPVEAFIDETAEPTEADLQKLFAEHRANYPNFTTEGRLDEGAPGFHQPRKVALEYLEIPFESVEKSIGEISEAEVEAYYEENYKSGPVLNPPADDGEAASDDAPMLPELEPDDTPDGEPPADDQPEGKKPEEATPPAEKDEPAADAPAKSETTEQPSAEEKPESPATDDAEAPAPETQTPAEDAPADEPAEDTTGTSDEEGSSSLTTRSSLQLVAYFDDETPDETSSETPASDSTPADEPSGAEPATEEKPTTDADAPADEEPAPKAETPAEEKPEEAPAAESKPEAPEEPAAETSDKPESDKPARDEKPATDNAPADETAPDTAPGETNKPRVLDDDLREEIREQILRRKTAERQQELMTQTYDYMSQDLAFGVTAPVDDPIHVTPEATTDKLKAYAEEHGLVYERTPLLSQRELSRSEEYPIGRAASATNFQSPTTATQMAFNSAPTDLYRPEQVLDIESGSRFVFWKVEDVPAFIPESLDAPGIREQVVATWRQLQAREKAKARADELAKAAQGVDKPLSEVFAGATVTGAEEGQTLSVIHPPRFSWLSAANAQMSPNPFNRPAPTLTELRTVPGDIGEEFMETVFNDLKPGEVGVAHSFDLEYYYVVRVDERTYGTSTDLQAFRDRFTTQPVFDQFGFSDYSKLAARELGQYQTNWANELFERHKVDFTGLERQRSEDVES